MTPVEIMALAVIVLSIIKLIVILINPRAWIRGVGGKLYTSSVATVTICFILATIGLYYLLQEITIIQFFAAILVVWLIMVIAVAPFGKIFLSGAESVYSNKKAVWKKSWLSIIIWLALLIWAVKELLV